MVSELEAKYFDDRPQANQVDKKDFCEENDA